MERGGAAGVCASAGCVVGCSDFLRALRLSPPPRPPPHPLLAHQCPCRGVWSCRCVLGKEGGGGWCCVGWKVH